MLVKLIEEKWNDKAEESKYNRAGIITKRKMLRSKDGC